MHFGTRIYVDQLPDEPVLFGIEATTGKVQHHRVAPLELRKGPPPARLIGELVIGKTPAFTDVAAHVASKLKGPGPKIPTGVQQILKWVASFVRSQKLPGRVDEPDVAERLREVAEELIADLIDLFGQPTDVIDEGGAPLEHGSGPGRLARLGQGLGQPEGAQEQGALLTFEPVVGPIAIDQS